MTEEQAISMMKERKEREERENRKNEIKLVPFFVDGNQQQSDIVIEPFAQALRKALESEGSGSGSNASSRERKKLSAQQKVA
jgi:hypothetical protein